MQIKLPDFSGKKFQYIIGGVILIAALVPSVYFYKQYQFAQNKLANPNLFAQEEAKKYVNMVAKLMNLPSDEVPTLATVNDKEKLKSQPFFANTENGDKVLIYTNAKKAILFRPSINKIIDVAPINIGPTASDSAVKASPTPAPVKFVLLNGTTIVGLTKKFQASLKAKMSNAEVVDTDNAKKRDYEKSILVDVKGNKSQEATKLAKDFNLTLTLMPTDEATPASDFLVILGTDQK